MKAGVWFIVGACAGACLMMQLLQDEMSEVRAAQRLALRAVVLCDPGGNLPRLRER